MKSERSKDQRKERRFYLTKPVAIALYLGRKSEVVTCSLLNVSRSGLCVGAQAPLPDNSRVILKAGEDRVALRTVWSLAASHDHDKVRYGFACIDPAIELIGALRRAGFRLGETSDKLQSEDEEFAEQFNK